MKKPSFWVPKLAAMSISDAGVSTVGSDGCNSVRHLHDVAGRFRHECHPFNHRKTVLFAQVPVNLHGERASILVTEPPAHGWNINA